MMSGRLQPQAVVHLRDELRNARARAAGDSEAYEALLYAIERFGCALTGTIGTLGSYKDQLVQLARQSVLSDIGQTWREWHVPFVDQYEVVRTARNDALHQGAFARHLTTHAIQLALVLEDALMSDAWTVGAISW
jgi:hypothetical protein